MTYYELYHFNPNHDPRNGQFTSAKGVYKELKNRGRHFRDIPTMRDEVRPTSIGSMMLKDTDFGRAITEGNAGYKFINETVVPMMNDYYSNWDKYSHKAADFAYDNGLFPKSHSREDIRSIYESGDFEDRPYSPVNFYLIDKGQNPGDFHTTYITAYDKFIARAKGRTKDFLGKYGNKKVTLVDSSFRAGIQRRKINELVDLYMEDQATVFLMDYIDDDPSHIKKMQDWMKKNKD